MGAKPPVRVAEPPLFIGPVPVNVKVTSAHPVGVGVAVWVLVGVKAVSVWVGVKVWVGMKVGVWVGVWVGVGVRLKGKEEV